MSTPLLAPGTRRNLTVARFTSGCRVSPPAQQPIQELRIPEPHALPQVPHPHNHQFQRRDDI